MSALSQIHAHQSMVEAPRGAPILGGFLPGLGRSLSAPAALWEAHEDQNAPLTAHVLDQGQSRDDPASLSGTRLGSVGRESSPTFIWIRRPGGHRVRLSASFGRGGRGAGAPEARELDGRSLAASGAPLHSAGLAPLARADAPIALAAVHALRGTAPTPQQEAFPRSAEGGPTSVEEKTPMLDATDAAPLLRSPANPDGWDLRDLLSRVRAELAAQNVALRERGGDFDRAELRAGQEAVRFLAYADAPASELASLRALREMADAERGAERRAA